MAYIETITLKSGKKSYRAQVKANGKRFTKQFKLERDAKAWARDIESDREMLDHAPDALSRKMTVAKAMDEYLAQHSGKDRQNEETRLDWWRDEIGHLKLSQLGRPLIKKYQRKLEKKPAKRNNTKGLQHPIGPATVNRYMQAMSSMMSFAVEEGWTVYNPVLKIKDKAEPEPDDRFLTEEERPRLLEACKASAWDGLYPIVLLALTTGARRGELSTLKWIDVDLDRGEITLRHTKSGKTRVVPLVEDAQQVLRDWGKTRPIDGGLVFPSRTNASKPRAFETAWQSALTEAEIEGFKFHTLRHSCASYLVQRGFSLAIVSAVLGHSTVTVSERYSHLIVDTQRDALKEAFKGRL